METQNSNRESVDHLDQHSDDLRNSTENRKSKFFSRLSWSGNRRPHSVDAKKHRRSSFIDIIRNHRLSMDWAGDHHNDHPSDAADSQGGSESDEEEKNNKKVRRSEILSQGDLAFFWRGLALMAPGGV